MSGGPGGGAVCGVVRGGTVAGATVVLGAEVVLDEVVDDELAGVVVVVGTDDGVVECGANRSSGNVGSVVRDGAVEPIVTGSVGSVVLPQASTPWRFASTE